MEHELIALTQRLLDSLNNNDWASYEALSDPAMTGIESVSFGQILEGLEFHRLNVSIKPLIKNRVTSIVSPKVRILGDVGIIAYTRINRTGTERGLSFDAALETRVWHRQGGAWKQVHFHRTDLPQES